MKKSFPTRQFLLLCFPILIVLFPLVFSRKTSSEIDMIFENKAMEKELLRCIPQGTSTLQARKILSSNGFSCTQGSSLNCEKIVDTGSAFGLTGTMWFAKFSITNQQITGVNVWVTPEP